MKNEDLEKDNTFKSFVSMVSDFLENEGYHVLREGVYAPKDNEQKEFPMLAVASKRNKGMVAVLSTEFGFSEWKNFAEKVLSEDSKVRIDC